MPVDVPIVDARDRDRLVADVRALVPFYTPGWRMADAGPGRALVEAFLLFQRHVVTRLNRTPEKLFLAFLDRLGLTLLPALPARAPVSFQLAAGASQEVTVPARTEVTAGDVTFETERAFVASPARLVAAFSVVPPQDAILDHASVLGGTHTAVLFTPGPSQPNLQEHALYLGDRELFNLASDGTIAVDLDVSDPLLLARSRAVRWEWWGKEATATSVDRWNPFEAPIATSRTGEALRSSRLTLSLGKRAGEIEEVEIGGVKSRWIRCRLAVGLEASSPLATLTVRAVGAAPAKADLVPDAAFAADIPLPLPPERGVPLLPFGVRPRQGDVFYLASQEALSKKGAPLTLSWSAVAGGIGGLAVERTYGIGKNFRDRLVAAGIRTTADLIRESPERIAEIIRNPRRPRIPTASYVNRARSIQEAAAKQYYDRVASPTGTERAAVQEPRLSWEYWNGQGWIAIPALDPPTASLLAPGSITFRCPGDIAPTRVAGQENYWIRVRIAAGDYGQEKFRFDGQTWQTDTTDIHPPELGSVKFSYTATGRRPAVVLTRNNLDVVRVADDVAFRPFVPLEDEHAALYLGFDRPLVNGPFAVLLALEEQEYPEAIRPRVTWECSTVTSAFAPLGPDDETSGLIRTGVVTFLGPANTAVGSRFGRTLFWVRAVDADDAFAGASSNAATITALRGGTPASGGAAPPCPQLTVPFFQPGVMTSTSGAPAPRLTGLHPNTTWVIQTESIRGERFGSSDGTSGQSFRLTRVPVVSSSIWVDEEGALTDEEIGQLRTHGDAFQEDTDALGNRIAVWVRWSPVADLMIAAREDRAYVLDPAQGIVQFGDGIRGKVPPVGRENLRADYQVGGGSAGNVPVGAIKTLKSSVARIDKVVNPLGAAGGADAEPVARLIERGPRVLRHRNRAVTREDYEWLAREASRDVARVRCLPHFDDQGRSRAGWVTVLIVPAGDDPRPTPSPTLREQVRSYVAARASIVVTGSAHLVVAGPVYLRASVTVDVFPVSLDVAAMLEPTIRARLAAYLHPLTGGLDGRGWPFGELPCLSDVVAIIQGIGGVDHLENLRTRLEDPRTGEFIVATPSDEIPPPPPYTLVSSGEHRITVVRAS